jgi:hypothetical protein
MNDMKTVVSHGHSGDKNRLWFRARAICSDVIDDNGDLFPKESLLSEIDGAPAYRTFIGRPVLINFNNSNKLGEITDAEWDEDEKCVYIMAYINIDDHPHIVNGIREGYIRDVAMSCNVEYSECSICGNKARAEREYCQHIVKSKGRDAIHEINYSPKFSAVSFVSDGSFRNCVIEEVLNHENS